MLARFQGHKPFLLVSSVFQKNPSTMALNCKAFDFHNDWWMSYSAFSVPTPFQSPLALDAVPLWLQHEHAILKRTRTTRSSLSARGVTQRPMTARSSFSTASLAMEGLVHNDAYEFGTANAGGRGGAWLSDFQTGWKNSSSSSLDDVPSAHALEKVKTRRKPTPSVAITINSPPGTGSPGRAAIPPLTPPSIQPQRMGQLATSAEVSLWRELEDVALSCFGVSTADLNLYQKCREEDILKALINGGGASDQGLEGTEAVLFSRAQPRLASWWWLSTLDQGQLEAMAGSAASFQLEDEPSEELLAFSMVYVLQYLLCVSL